MKVYEEKQDAECRQSEFSEEKGKNGAMAMAQRASAPELGGKYLTFSLNGEQYGISILKIREIIGMMPVTKTPNTPPFVKGVINLRGKIIPVIDLRLRFEMEESIYDERTCIIVVEVTTHKSKTVAGIVVDAVSEVLNINEEEIEPPPEISLGSNSNCIMGIAKIEGSVKMLLDIDAVLSMDDLCELIDG